MEQQLSAEHYDVAKGYNPFKDPSFWSAVVLGGVFGIIRSILVGADPSAQILSLVFMLSWVFWVVFRKGRNGSLLFGFLFAIVVSAVFYLPISQWKQDQFDKQIQQMNAELRKKSHGYNKIY